jgi:biopolymer transport protein ExbD
MKISGQRNYLLSLESVAMTDIVLNMFIFFFISFSLLYTFNPNKVQKLDVKLPKASNVSTIEKLNQLDITLTNENIMYVGQEMVNAKELKERIRIKQRENPDLIVILRADKLVSFKKIVEVLDVLTELGITNLNIAAVRD